MSQDSCPKKKEEQHTESIVPIHKLLSWLKIRKACLIDDCTMIFVGKNLQTCLEYFGMLKVCLLFRFAPVSPWLQRWSCANASDEVGSKENIGVICVRPKVHYGADVWSENMTLWCSSIAPSVQINLPVWSNWETRKTHTDSLEAKRIASSAYSLRQSHLTNQKHSRAINTFCQLILKFKNIHEHIRASSYNANSCALSVKLQHVW